MIHKKGWWNAYWHNWLKDHLTRKMLYHKKLAEYNLYRHNEAVEAYVSKKNARENKYGTPPKSENPLGFNIAEESADNYAREYSINWELYIKYKQRLEVLTYQEPPVIIEPPNT